MEDWLINYYEQTDPLKRQQMLLENKNETIGFSSKKNNKTLLLVCLVAMELYFNVIFLGSIRRRSKVDGSFTDRAYSIPDLINRKEIS